MIVLDSLLGTSNNIQDTEYQWILCGWQCWKRWSQQLPITDSTVPYIRYSSLTMRPIYRAVIDVMSRTSESFALYHGTLPYRSFRILLNTGQFFGERASCSMLYTNCVMFEGDAAWSAVASISYLPILHDRVISKHSNPLFLKHSLQAVWDIVHYSDAIVGALVPKRSSSLTRIVAKSYCQRLTCRSKIAFVQCALSK